MFSGFHNVLRKQKDLVTLNTILGKNVEIFVFEPLFTGHDPTRYNNFCENRTNLHKYQQKLTCAADKNRNEVCYCRPHCENNASSPEIIYGLYFCQE